MGRLTYIFVALALLNFSYGSEYFDLPCSSNDECSSVENSICDVTEGNCYCSGYSVVNAHMTKCLPVLPGAGSVCEEDVQCSAAMLVGGACISGKCGCVEGMHYHEGRCWQTKELGAACSAREECLSLHAPNSLVCQDNTCQCAEGFYQREYSDCRPEVTDLEGACALDTDCQMDHSYCNNMKCACLSGETGVETCTPPTREQLNSALTKQSSIEIQYEADLYPHKLSNKEYGAECGIDGDCTMVNAQCTPSGYCACKKGYFQTADDPNTCVPEIGSPCSEVTDCTIGNSTCTDNMCTCLLGHGATSTRQQCLLQLTAFKRTCTERSQCMLYGGRSICKLQGSASVCDCDPTSRHIEADHICWIIKGPGKECTEARDCYITDKNQPITCDAGMCKCNDGYHPSTDGTNCHLNAPELDNKCTENADCEVENSVCSASLKCACNTGYVQLDGKCITGVGGSCTDIADCAGVENSECTSNMCACPAGFVSSTDITKCFPEGGMGDTCSEVQQCTTALGVYAACTEDVCTCAKKHHLALGQCIPSKGLGESCTRSVDCNLPGGNTGVVCRNYVCSCDFGYQPSDMDDKCKSSAYFLRSSSLLILIAVLSSLINF